MEERGLRGAFFASGIGVQPFWQRASFWPGQRESRSLSGIGKGDIMVGEKRAWGGQVQQGGSMVGEMRVLVEGSDPRCWVDRMAAVQKRVMFRIEMKVRELAQVAAVDMGR